MYNQYFYNQSMKVYENMINTHTHTIINTLTFNSEMYIKIVFMNWLENSAIIKVLFIEPPNHDTSLHRNKIF